MPDSDTPRPGFGKEIDLALEGIPQGADLLAASRALRRKLEPEAARRALSLLGLRRKAAGKLGDAGALWLTEKGLEQATRGIVAEHRARRIASFAPRGPVLDATAGVGGDAMALAAAGLSVVAADAELEHALCARANLRSRGVPARVVVARAESAAIRAPYLLLDPDRRPSGRRQDRSDDPEQWSPSLPDAVALARSARGACIKLSPALSRETRAVVARALAGHAHHWQWTSASRELCEVALWAGEWAGEGDPQAHEALALAQDRAPERLVGRPQEVESLSVAEAQRIEWIAEPDPAVIRAELVGALAWKLGMRPVAPQIAYLGAEERPPELLATVFRVLDRVSCDPRRVRAMLRSRGIGEVAVKKRGHPDSAEKLAKRFRARGRRRGLLIVTRIGDGHTVFLVERDHSSSLPLRTRT